MGALAVLESGRRAFDVDLPHLIVALIAGGTTILCVLIHYEAMSRGMRVLPRLGIPRRMRICGLILGLLLAHVVEVWLFAIVYWLLDPYAQLGQITGPFDDPRVRRLRRQRADHDPGRDRGARRAGVHRLDGVDRVHGDAEGLGRRERERSGQQRLTALPPWRGRARRAILWA